jgi:hypothetical protein
MIASDAENRFDTIHDWHLEIHQGHIGFVPFKEIERLLPVGRFGNQRHIFMRLESECNSVTNQRVVVNGNKF